MNKDYGIVEIGQLSDDSFLFKEVTWKFPRVYIYANRADYDIQSPSFSFAGATWALHLAPNGRRIFDSIGWIDLGIERLHSNIPQHHVFCKFYFKTRKGKEFQPCQGSYLFDSCPTLSSLLYSEKSDFLPKENIITKDDLLTIVCQIKTPEIHGIEQIPQLEFVEQVAKPPVEELGQEPESSAGICKEQPVEEFRQEPESCACTCKGSSVSCHSVTLSGIKTLLDLKELFLKQEECDVILKVTEKDFPAHKAILIARSPVFASTFRNDMKEKATGVIDIEDCDISSFSNFLCFLYCGNAEIISTENVFSLFTTADKYDVQDLRSECMDFMKNNLSVDTFCDTITLALQHSEKELIELATDFFTDNLQEIILTVKWQSFLLENTIQGNELLIKALASYKK